MSTTLHLVSGKAGSGKTTFARALAEREKGLFFCEDEWLARVGGPIASVPDYVREAGRVRSVMAPMTVRLLGLGVPVVFDFAGNTLSNRAWVRGLAETAGARLLVHHLAASDEFCRERVRARNVARPEGAFFGHVTDELFDAVTRYFVPPGEAEGFEVVTYDVERAPPG